MPEERLCKLRLCAVTERHRIKDEDITISMSLGQEGGEPGFRHFTTRAASITMIILLYRTRHKRQAFDDMTMSMSFFRGTQKSCKSNTTTEIVRGATEPTQEHRHSTEPPKGIRKTVLQVFSITRHFIQHDLYRAPQNRDTSIVPAYVVTACHFTRHTEQDSARCQHHHALSTACPGFTAPQPRYRPGIVFNEKYGSIKCAASQTDFGIAERWQLGQQDWTRPYGLPDTGLLFRHRTTESGGVNSFIEFLLSMSSPLTTQNPSFGAVHLLIRMTRPPLALYLPIVPCFLNLRIISSSDSQRKLPISQI